MIFQTSQVTSYSAIRLPMRFCSIDIEEEKHSFAEHEDYSYIVVNPEVPFTVIL